MVSQSSSPVPSSRPPSKHHFFPQGFPSHLDAGRLRYVYRRDDDSSNQPPGPQVPSSSRPVSSSVLCRPSLQSARHSVPLSPQSASGWQSRQVQGGCLPPCPDVEKGGCISQTRTCLLLPTMSRCSSHGTQPAVVPSNPLFAPPTLTPSSAIFPAAHCCFAVAPTMLLAQAHHGGTTRESAILRGGRVRPAQRQFGVAREEADHLWSSSSADAQQALN